MKILKRVLCVVLAAALSLSVTACSLFGKKAKLPFDEFCENLFVDAVSDPLNAHFTISDEKAYGITFDKEDYNLGNFDLDEVDESYKAMRESYNELCAYDYDKLSEDQKVTYTCLKAYMEIQLAYEGSDIMYNVFAPNSGIFANLSTNFVEYVFYDKDDVDKYLIFLEDVKRFANESFAFARLQSDKGYFMADNTVDSAIEVCQDYLDAEVDPYIATFEAKINAMDLTDDEKQEYIEKNRKIVEENVRPSYEKAIDVLEELKGTAKNNGGLAGFGKEGKKYYEAIVMDKTSSSMTPDEVADYLEEKLTEAITELGLIQSTNPNAVSEWSEYEPDERTPKEVLEFILSNMTKDFPKPATEKYNIEYQLPACEIEGTLAYYVTARIDDISVNNIKVNGSAVKDDALQLYTTMAHEGYPGHLYQFTGFYDSDTANVRKVLDFICSTEGWAQYVSNVAVDYLDASDDVKRLIYIDNILSYIIPSRVDIGVNYEGWGLKETGEYLSNVYNISDDYENDPTVKYFYNFVVSEPGLLLPYTIGELKMNDLRDKAELELSDRFDALEYHTFIMECGIAPIAYYEDALSDWIDSKK